MLTDVPPPPQHLTERVVRMTSAAGAAGSATESPRIKVVPIQLVSPAAAWLRHAISEVEVLTGLSRGWDSYGAVPVSAAAATKAVAFLVDNAFASLPKPSVVPLSQGGIQFEWHRGDIDLEIAFCDEESGVFIEDSRSGESREAPITAARALLLDKLQRLAE